VNPIAVICFTASTSSSLAGVIVLCGSSRGGARVDGGGKGSWCLFFFFPNGNRILSLECLVGASFNFSWLSLEEVEGLGTGEVIRAGGDTGRAGDDARLTEGRGDEVSTALGDVGVDDIEGALGWGVDGASVKPVLFEVVEVKDESRFKLGLTSKVAKASSNEVGLAGSTCVALPFVVGEEADCC